MPRKKAPLPTRLFSDSDVPTKSGEEAKEHEGREREDDQDSEGSEVTAKLPYRSKVMQAADKAKKDRERQRAQEDRAKAREREREDQEELAARRGGKGVSPAPQKKIGTRCGPCPPRDGERQGRGGGRRMKARMPRRGPGRGPPPFLTPGIRMRTNHRL